ncbi:MAG: thioredoxin domain-containing protein [Candidatus Binataceae bacterium]
MQIFPVIRLFRVFPGYVLAVAIAAPLLAFSPAYAAGSDPVVATVGSHKITEAELDTKIKPEMAALDGKIYDLKHQALQSMADEYLIEEAAKKEKLSVTDYLKKEVEQKADKVTEADAQKYYDQRKGPGTPPFDQIKGRLIAALQNQAEQAQREKLLDSLRKQEPTRILLKAPRIEVASAGHPSVGPANAPVTIIEFSDFQCPFCKRVEPTLKEVREKYGDNVRLVYMDYPLPMHNHALDAAKAGRCAAEQGKFWPFHDAMFADQSKESPADLKAIAKNLGLDTGKFDTCLDQAKYEAGVQSDLEQGRQLGIDGTPAFFINGRMLVGAQPPESFNQIIDEELSSKGGGSNQAKAN